MNKFIERIRRYLVMKRLTGNLGKVVDTEDKIICYVKKRNSKRERLTDYFYCRGINKSNKVLANIYNLNKPITYVFNDREFKKHEVVIFGYDNANIIINNCNFNRGLIINNPKGITYLDNTNIKPFLNLSLSSSELILMNMNIKKPMNLMMFDISLYGDNIKLVNSMIGEAFEKTNINVYANNKLDLVNSKISGEVVELTSQKVISNNSFIRATEILAIDTNKSNELNIKAPCILSNDDSFSKEKDNLNKNEEETIEIKKRGELLNLLKNIKTLCENINNCKVEEYKNDLSKEEIGKILRK